LFADNGVIGPRAARAWPARSAGQYARAGPARMRRQGTRAARASHCSSRKRA